MTPFHKSAVEYGRMRRYRLERVREQLHAHDYAAIVLFDPPNVRYATDVSNMQVWALHNICRYAFIATEGPVILFDYGSTRHLSAGYDLLDETRSAVSHVWFTNGPRQREKIDLWVAEIKDLVHKHGATSAWRWISSIPCPRWRWPAPASR
jgi:Xaa-Pro aminopeptidase